MSKWFQHEEYQAIEEAVKVYRNKLDADQPTNMSGDDPRLKKCADAGEVLADRIEQALRSTDWRRVEAREQRAADLQKGTK